MVDSWEKVIDPNFINAELIGGPGAEKVVTIKDIDFRECFDRKSNSKIQKMCLIFDECKPMILNKTNSKFLAKTFGTEQGLDPKDCVGKKITLYVVALSVGGKDTTGIRLKEFSDIKCESCGKTIMPLKNHTLDWTIDYSVKNTGKKLCIDCMKKAKEGKNNG